MAHHAHTPKARRLRPLVISVLVMVMLLMGCIDSTRGDTEYEGDTPQECSDGADNDRDGDFDCADDGCAGSPACTGEGTADAEPRKGENTGTVGFRDSSAPTRPPSDGSLGPGIRLQEFQLEYETRWHFEDGGAGAAMADCTVQFAAAGEQVTSTADYVTFEGTWGIVESDCDPSLQDPSVIWHDPSGRAYATFWFSNDLTTLDRWLQHRDAAAVEPLTSPAINGQWFMTDMATPVGDDHTAQHQETERTVIEGVLPIVLTHTVTVRFQSD